MRRFLVKICTCLSIMAFFAGYMYAQHCDYQDLLARYEQDKAVSEKMAQDYAKLKRQLATKQKEQAMPNKTDKVVLAVVNNNPLNVKQANSKWVGQQGVDEQGHIIFESNTHGVRAAASVLMNYYHVHKLDTLNGIIDRFCTAPPKRKAKYAAFVGKRLNIAPDKKFNVLQRLPELLAAMARFESGHEYPQELFAPYSLLASAYVKGGE